jgi:transcription factor S
MLFCPECGSIMRPVEKDEKNIMQCSCGYSSDNTDNLKFSEKTKSEKKVEIVDEEDDYKSYPTTQAKCSKCGNETCYYWLVQTRAADEPETKFLRCTKCKHTFRDYS